MTSNENITITEAIIPSSSSLDETVIPGQPESSASPSVESIKTVQAETTNVISTLPDFGNLTTRFVYGLARNLYTIKKIALFLAFVINLMLLFYKVSSYIPESGEADDAGGSGEDLGSSAEGGGSGENDGSGSDEDNVIEWIQMEESWYYLEPLLRSLAMIHMLLSFFILIAYYNLKVPLIIFKREKEIARRIEFDGLYISEQPEDNYRAYWDKLVISSKSFPMNYWDKFVKKRVVSKYAEQYDYEALSKLLGMSKNSSSNLEETPSTGFLSFITNCDWKYQLWKVGVTFMDNVSLVYCILLLIQRFQVFLYNLGYFTLSLMGNFSYFFFAAHLLDIAVVIPTLKTILQSVTHNGKQVSDCIPSKVSRFSILVGVDCNVVDYCGIHLHCDCVQLFPQILRSRGR